MSVDGMKPTLLVLGESESRLSVLARAKGWQVRQTNLQCSTELDFTVAVVLVTDDQPESWRQQFPLALFLGEGEHASKLIDLQVPAGAKKKACVQLLNHGEIVWQRNRKMLDLARDVGVREQQTRKLSEIGIALSQRLEINQLLKTILTEARKLAGCDAGSLYLIEGDENERELVFKLAQNDSLDVSIVEQRLPLSKNSVAGYVALSGKELDIPDVYAIPESAPYGFNDSFDKRMGYRTRSMLVIPMRDHRDEVVGVLQFINRIEEQTGTVIQFDREDKSLLRAVASQAAVSIQKNTLIRDISRLFEGFVQASVKAIEQRDPSTSGHSFRVAETTVALLQALPESGLSRFRSLSLTEESIKEVRYAALLHDFGKVGVREHVLLKANKLSEDRLQVVRYRVELGKERLRRQAVEQQLEALHHGARDVHEVRRKIKLKLDKQISVLEQYFEVVSRANKPSMTKQAAFEMLGEIRDYAFREFDGTISGLITDDDLVALSIRRGSLTGLERQEIQAHVAHTIEFLNVLPWPPELARVPEIAGAHHEKLDGSGYPYGLIGDQIPLPSRVMTVCDIYDALTSMDRPYKPAMAVGGALDILREEAKAQLLDHDIVEIFIASRGYHPMCDLTDDSQKSSQESRTGTSTR